MIQLQTLSYYLCTVFMGSHPDPSQGTQLGFLMSVSGGTTNNLIFLLVGQFLHKKFLMQRYLHSKTLELDFFFSQYHLYLTDKLYKLT